MPAALEAHYHEQIDSTAHGHWRIRAAFAALFVMLAGLPVGSALALLYLVANQTPSLSALLFEPFRYWQERVFQQQLMNATLLLVVFVIGSTLALGLLVVAAGAVDRWRFRAWVRRRRLRAVESANAQPLLSIISPLAEKMGLHDRRIRLWTHASRAATPSVIEDQSAINLVLPIGAVWLCLRDPAAATAMIAHEFGHVLQRDTQVWKTAEAAVFAFTRVLMPLSALGVLQWLVLDPLATGGWASSSLTPPPTDYGSVLAYTVLRGAAASYHLMNLGLCYAVYRYVLRMRRRSEQLADMAAVVFTGDAALLRAVESWTTSEAEDDGLHLVKPRRLDWIRRVAAGHTPDWNSPDNRPAKDRLPLRVMVSAASLLLGIALALSLLVSHQIR